MHACTHMHAEFQIEGVFAFWCKENGQKRLQSQTDESRKRSLKPGLTHREKMDASFLRMCWSKKNFFIKVQYLVVGGKLNLSSFTHSNSRKIFQTKEMHSIALIIVHTKNWPQRSKLFNQLLRSKIQPLTAHADRLHFCPKLMQFRVGVYCTLRSARKAVSDLCMPMHIYVRKSWHLLYARDKWYLFPRYHSAEISVHWLLPCLLII